MPVVVVELEDALVYPPLLWVQFLEYSLLYLEAAIFEHQVALIVDHASREEIQQLLLGIFCLLERTEVDVETRLRHQVRMVRSVATLPWQEDVIAHLH